MLPCLGYIQIKHAIFKSNIFKVEVNILGFTKTWAK